MDEKLQRQLIKQLKLLNFWITLFGVLVLLGLSLIGFMLYKVIVFTQQAGERLEQVQSQTRESLNVTSKLCEDSKLSNFLRSNSDICSP